MISLDLPENGASTSIHISIQSQLKHSVRPDHSGSANYPDAMPCHITASPAAAFLKCRTHSLVQHLSAFVTALVITVVTSLSLVGTAHAVDFTAHPPQASAYFDPERAQHRYLNVESLNELTGIPEYRNGSALEQYEDFRDRIDHFPPNKLFEVFRSYPKAKEMEAIHNTYVMHKYWLELYESRFPNRHMGFAQWQNEQTPDCTQNRGIELDQLIFHCLQIPDWRNDNDRAFDDASYQRGQWAQSVWSSSGCARIQERRTQESLLDDADAIHSRKHKCPQKFRDKVIRFDR